MNYEKQDRFKMGRNIEKKEDMIMKNKKQQIRKCKNCKKSLSEHYVGLFGIYCSFWSTKKYE